MGSAVHCCSNQPDDPCSKLAQEIDDLINRDKRQGAGGGTHGLKHRFREQISGASGPPGSGVGDPKIWETHDKAIKEQQKGLRDRLNEFNKNNCGQKIPISSEAWEWATKPAPKPSEWKPVQSTSTEGNSDFMKKMSEVTGLTGVALIIYVIVSEGSRVLFPPRNAIPVP